MENLKEISSEEIYTFAISLFYCGVLITAFVIGLFGLFNLLELATEAAQNYYPVGPIN